MCSGVTSEQVIGHYGTHWRINVSLSRLQYVSNGDTADLHQAIDIIYIFIIFILVNDTFTRYFTRIDKLQYRDSFEWGGDGVTG